MKNNSTYDVHFWKIAIWHIRRFLYADAQSNGVRQLRETCFRSSCARQFLKWLDTALVQWDQLDDNWSEHDALDYLYLLKYIKNGNLLLYKLRSYWLWKIRPFAYHLLGK